MMQAARRIVIYGISFFSIVSVSSGCGPAPQSPADAQSLGEAEAEEARAAIRRVLDQQVEAWNRGDLEGFMDGYAQTDSLRFASGGNVRHGWEEALASYRKSYSGQEEMGVLSFADIDIRLLCRGQALVFGRWHLDRAEGPLEGLFTLVVEKRPIDDGAAWRVVHDHTSAAD